MKTIYVGSFNHLNKRHEFVVRGLSSTLLSIPHNSVDKIRVRVRKYYHHQNKTSWNNSRQKLISFETTNVIIGHQSVSFFYF